MELKGVKEEWENKVSHKDDARRVEMEIDVREEIRALESGSAGLIGDGQ